MPLPPLAESEGANHVIGPDDHLFFMADGIRSGGRVQDYCAHRLSAGCKDKARWGRRMSSEAVVAQRRPWVSPTGQLPVSVTPSGPSDILAYPMTPRHGEAECVPSSLP